MRGFVPVLGQIMTFVIFRSESRNARKMPEFPTWNSELVDNSKLFFPFRDHFLLKFPVVLNALKSEISEFPVVLKAALSII
jgi:hypothetical protein